MPSVSVLYQLHDEYSNSANSGDFNYYEVSFNEDLTLGHLVKYFPLGISYHLSVKDQNGVYLTLSNTNSKIPFSNGVVYVRAAPLAAVPSNFLTFELNPLTKDKITSNIQASNSQEKLHTEHEINNRTEEIFNKKDSYHWNDEYLGGSISQNVVDAASGLFKMVGSAANWATEQLYSDALTIGRYRLKRVKEMAEGGFSKVSLVKDISTKELFAVKEIICQEKSSVAAVETEIKVLSSISHECVIPLIDFSVASGKVNLANARIYSLLFPFFPRGTAWDMICAHSSGSSWPFPEIIALRLFRDVCSGVQAMHAKGWAHRDIKPMNVLISNNGHGVLMDLGSAAPLVREVKNRQEALNLEDEAATMCSAPYRSPELMHVKCGLCLDGRVDVWSLGCTLFAFAFGHSPFETPREGVQKLAIMSGRFNFPVGFRNMGGAAYTSSYCNLVKWALNAEHDSRPQLKEILLRLNGLLERNS